MRHLVRDADALLLGLRPMFQHRDCYPGRVRLLRNAFRNRYPRLLRHEQRLLRNRPRLRDSWRTWELRRELFELLQVD